VEQEREGAIKGSKKQRGILLPKWYKKIKYKE